MRHVCSICWRWFIEKIDCVRNFSLSDNEFFLLWLSVGNDYDHRDR